MINMNILKVRGGGAASVYIRIFSNGTQESRVNSGEKNAVIYEASVIRCRLKWIPVVGYRFGVI